MARRKGKKVQDRHGTKPGTSPGTIVAHPEAHPTHMSVRAYGPEELVVVEDALPEQILALLERFPVTWVHVDGLADIGTLNRLGEMFQLHGLALEDVVNVHQRPKTEEYPSHLFMVVHIPHANDDLTTQQLSLFLGKNFVLSFKEKQAGFLNPIRERIKHLGGRMRSHGPDYLAYAILDLVVDSYFPVLAGYSDTLDALEDRIIASPTSTEVAEAHGIKRSMHLLRNMVWPLREVVNALLRDETPFVSEQVRLYLRDCYDHAIQLMDYVQTLRDFASDLVDLYMSGVSNAMNGVMKVLTIIATIFIPLGFIAGVYGMNFDTEASPWNMPELHWYWGYPFALGIMGAAAGGMLVFFWWKKWL